MIIKKGASLEGVTEQTKAAIEKVDDIYRANGTQFFVTSGTEGHAGDGVHKKTSKHYTGDAFDCRIRNIAGGHQAVVNIYNTIRRVLGDDFDVVLEKDHIHVEYDPKTKVMAVVRTIKRAITMQHDAVTVINLIGKAVTATIPFYKQILSLFRRWFKK
tara:strand:- start:16171 stop:16644 length:474 start_codon:yes stop_codon:yes gene_type:complete